MILHVQPLNDYAKQVYQLPDNTRLDSGYDLFCTEHVVIYPKKSAKIRLGIACQPHSTNAHGYYLYPRSSIYKTPLRLANSVGIIDYGYRGEICAMVDNISDEIFCIEQGDRLFQLCSPDLKPLVVRIVDTLESSERGECGFGSTG